MDGFHRNGHVRIQYFIQLYGKPCYRLILVRLVGIDSPETGKVAHDPDQPYILQPRKLLTRMVPNNTRDVR
jgi:endonuclease YncB( thermonuclease family)